MNIVVFGATGGTGRHVVDQLLRAGHEVTAVVRRPEEIAPRDRLTVRAGDVTRADSLHESCRGADVVVSCIGPRAKYGGQVGAGLRPGTVMSVGTVNMVAAAKAAGVRRFVFQSGIGLSDGRELSRANRWVMCLWRPLFGAAIRDKAEGERHLRESNLDWVIVRPVGLSRAPGKGRYLAGPLAKVAPLVPMTFEDCAACLVRAVDDQAWTREIVNVGSS